MENKKEKQDPQYWINKGLCPNDECGHYPLIYMDGCKSCKCCGWGACE